MGISKAAHSLKRFIYLKITHPFSERIISSIGSAIWFLEKKGIKVKNSLRLSKRKIIPPTGEIKTGKEVSESKILLVTEKE